MLNKDRIWLGLVGKLFVSLLRNGQRKSNVRSNKGFSIRLELDFFLTSLYQCIRLNLEFISLKIEKNDEL